jgi:hypothetical protein
MGIVSGVVQCGSLRALTVVAGSVRTLGVQGLFRGRGVLVVGLIRGSFGNMAKSAVNAHGVRGRMRRQGPLDRFDESVGEDESVLDRIAGIVDMPREAIAAAIRGEDERGLAGFAGDVAGDPLSYADDRGRIAAGSFNMDPGMRAADEFTDVASPGYRENAKRVAERGGNKQYATSLEEEEAGGEAEERRKQLMFALAALIGGGAGGMGVSKAMGPGPRPGLGVGARNPSQAEWNAMKMRQTSGRSQGANFHGMTGTPLRPHSQFVGGPQGTTRIPSKEVYDRGSMLRRGFRG